MGPPSRKTCWTSRSKSVARASRGSRVRRCTVSAASSRTRRSGARSRSPITTRSSWRGSGSPTSSRTVSCGSSTSTVPVPTRIASHSPAGGGCRAGPRRGDPARVPSAAALRPSSVVANFQVTNGRPCSTAKVHARLSARASSTRSPPATSIPAARRVAPPPRATRVGVGLGEHHAAYAGLAPAPVRTGPCGLRGCRARGSRRPSLRGRRHRPRRAPRLRHGGFPPRDGSPPRPRCRRRR